MDEKEAVSIAIEQPPVQTELRTGFICVSVKTNQGFQKIGSEYYLVAEPGHSEYFWSTGETTSSIQITDTGEYRVFVPYGSGYLSSEYMIITDITNPCLILEPMSLTGLS